MSAPVVLSDRQKLIVAEAIARDLISENNTLRAQVEAIIEWIKVTGCTCPGDFHYASLPDHENECPAQVEHLLLTTTGKGSRPTHSLDSRCTVQGCPECDHDPTPRGSQQ